MWHKINKNYQISTKTGNVRNKSTKTLLKLVLDERGYLAVEINGFLYAVHRLQAKQIPNPENKKIVDHINNNKHDNRLINLRWATVQENAWNTKLRKDNKTGVKGVYLVGNRYRAEIRHKKKKINIGTYPTLEEAKEARRLKANELFGNFTNICEKI